MIDFTVCASRKNIYRRQDSPVVYDMNTVVYIFKLTLFLKPIIYSMEKWRVFWLIKSSLILMIKLIWNLQKFT